MRVREAKGHRGETVSVSATVIDPRMAARRQEVHGRHLRRRFHLLVATACALVALVAVMGAARSPLLALDHTTVQGPFGAQTTNGQILFVAGLTNHPPLAEIDVDAVARRVARLAWIDSVTVTRRWPHTLTIAFSERRAVAQVAGLGGQWLVVDASGRILASRPAPSPDLVSVHGSPVAGRPGMGLGRTWSAPLDLATQLPAPLRSAVASVGSLGPDLEAVLRSGGRIRLCGDDQLQAKLVATSTMLANVDPASLGVIDVCVPSAPALSPRPPPPSTPSLTVPAEGA